MNNIYKIFLISSVLSIVALDNNYVYSMNNMENMWNYNQNNMNNMNNYNQNYANSYNQQNNMNYNQSNLHNYNQGNMNKMNNYNQKNINNMWSNYSHNNICSNNYNKSVDDIFDKIKQVSIDTDTNTLKNYISMLNNINAKNQNGISTFDAINQRHKGYYYDRHNDLWEVLKYQAQNEDLYYLNNNLSCKHFEFLNWEYSKFINYNISEKKSHV